MQKKKIGGQNGKGRMPKKKKITVLGPKWVDIPHEGNELENSPVLGGEKGVLQEKRWLGKGGDCDGLH